MFNHKKTGIELLKEKLETANLNMIKAVEHLKEAQAVHNEFYKLLFELQTFKVGDTNGNIETD
jgi:hypothetical protein